ncbi:MAG TPA: CDP-diacylglycerol--serine O-phosphatidyltransferase [Blastocatellia bacterium]|nr:CDP-diacylglycerol--serine O-phosphatidyltransferase [Blastocatellia bacterium]
MADTRNYSTLEGAPDRRMRRRLRKGVFVIPSLLTTANIFCGFYSVMESLLGIQSLSRGNVAEAASHFDLAAVNIGFAVLFDFLDGRIARLTGATSEFGLELDSIADVLSFGIAPAVLAYSWGYGNTPGLHKLAWSVSFMFVICGALRLARFNVQARQPKPDLPPKNPKVDKKAFVGLPIPAGASVVAALAHFSPTPIGYGDGPELSVGGRVVPLDGQVFSVALIVIMACLALLMVSTVRYTSFKNVGAGKNYHPRLLILLLALLVLAIWFYSQWALLILATLYATHGLLGKLWGMIKSRRGSTAEHGDVELESHPR